MIDGGESRNKQEAGIEEEYHFSGGGEYEPLSVKARSPAEAEKLWQEQRKKVESNQSLASNE